MCWRRLTLGCSRLKCLQKHPTQTQTSCRSGDEFSCVFSPRPGNAPAKIRCFIKQITSFKCWTVLICFTILGMSHFWQIVYDHSNMLHCWLCMIFVFQALVAVLFRQDIYSQSHNAHSVFGSWYMRENGLKSKFVIGVLRPSCRV